MTDINDIIKTLDQCNYHPQTCIPFDRGDVIDLSTGEILITSEAYNQWRNMSSATRAVAIAYYSLNTNQFDGSIEIEDMTLPLFGHGYINLESWQVMAVWSHLSSKERAKFLNDFEGENASGNKPKQIKDIEMTYESIEKAKRILSYGSAMVIVPLAT